MRTKGVPIVVAVDEHGIVRDTRPKPEDLERSFLDRTFEAPKAAKAQPAKPSLPDVEELRRRAEAANSAERWRALGDALALWHAPERIDEAIDAYSRAAKIDPKDGATLFRLGVCHSLRSESDRRRAGDFQKAVDLWSEALATDPNQYIWRRRIQQYGPRLDKPYPFYDWIVEATEAIKARGQTPVPLRVPPSGSETAQPIRQFAAASGQDTSPDPKGRIRRDEKRYVETEVSVVPSRIRPGDSARVHVEFRPNKILKAHWNNDAEPLRLWLDLPQGWQASRRLLAAPQPKPSQSDETRRIDFDVRPPRAAKPGPVRLPAYALYYVCEDVQGACWMLRRDLEVEIAVSP